MPSTVKKYSVAEHEWQNILESPEYLLHGIDVNGGTFVFLKTTRNKLAETSFIDGRDSMSDLPLITLPIEELLQWQQNHNNDNTVNRYIFHHSFCGSTLMARVLDIEGKVFSYKEPQILIQLAELKTAQNSYYRNKMTWKSLMSFVLSQFKQQWSNNEVNVIKPSSWLNSMLPELLFDGGASKAIFLSISRENFLIAVFRGGGDRIQFVYSLLKHLKTAYPEYSKVISLVENSQLTTVELFSRLTLITHSIQTKAFSRSIAMMNEGDHNSYSFSEFINNRTPCVHGVSSTLQLGLSEQELNNSLSNKFKKHSKIIQRAIDQREITKINTQVTECYQENFKETLKWADINLNENNFI